MLKILVLASGFAAAGYYAYPHILQKNQAAKAVEAAKPAFFVHHNVQAKDIAGTWILSPRSTQLLADASLPIGKRAHITLESWGGGEVYIPVGQGAISGPVSWQYKPGSEVSAASIKIRLNATRNYELHFSQVGARMVLITEANDFREGAQDHVRFLKSRGA